jgi:hypothetical protein
MGVTEGLAPSPSDVVAAVSSLSFVLSGFSSPRLARTSRARVLWQEQAYLMRPVV